MMLDCYLPFHLPQISLRVVSQDDIIQDLFKLYGSHKVGNDKTNSVDNSSNNEFASGHQIYDISSRSD